MLKVDPEGVAAQGQLMRQKREQKNLLLKAPIVFYQ